MASVKSQIRPAQLGDLDALTALYNHYVVETPITFDIEPWSVDARRGWFDHYAEEGPHRLLVADAGGEMLGYACSSRFRPKAAYDTSVETTVYLRPDALGRGLGRDLYGALFEALRDEDVHRAYAGITIPNDASEALHARFGFRPLGVYEEVGRKFERWWSVRWFEKNIDSPERMR